MSRVTELRLERVSQLLHVVFGDGLRAALPAEFLRVESPSAEVQGHGPNQKITVPGKSTVAITAVEPVGNYAVRLVFDDGHDTGIYSWDYLRELTDQQERRWRSYLDALAQQGLRR